MLRSRVSRTTDTRSRIQERTLVVEVLNAFRNGRNPQSVTSGQVGVDEIGSLLSNIVRQPNENGIKVVRDTSGKEKSRILLTVFLSSLFFPEASLGSVCSVPERRRVRYLLFVVGYPLRRDVGKTLGNRNQ